MSRGAAGLRHNEVFRGTGYPLRIGHRGAAGHAPENTLAAIRKGISLGADLVEVDIQRSRDGRLVLMHDELVDRTTNGSGLVSDLTWEDLQSLNAGDGERIPSLEAALEVADGNAGVMLEIKTPGIGSAVRDAVVASGFSARVIYASFLHSEVLEIRRLDPDAVTMALIEGVPVSGAMFARDAGASMVGLCVSFAPESLVEQLRTAGFPIFFYTVNDSRLIRRAIDLGVDGIISDYPERVPKIPRA